MATFSTSVPRVPKRLGVQHDPSLALRTESLVAGLRSACRPGTTRRPWREVPTAAAGPGEEAGNLGALARFGEPDDRQLVEYQIVDYQNYKPSTLYVDLPAIVGSFTLLSIMLLIAFGRIGGVSAIDWLISQLRQAKSRQFDKKRKELEKTWEDS